MLRIESRLLFCAALVFLLLLPTAISHAQTFQVIHTFTGGGDGSAPYSGLTIDGGGNLYGTTSQITGPGTVFQMKLKNGQWIFSTILSFSNADGKVPLGKPVFGPGGALYGTTQSGGSGNCMFGSGCGTVYSLRPPSTFCRSVSCPWSATLVTSFDGVNGLFPYYVDPVFDSAGNLYGTTAEGGASGDGNVFQLTRSGGGWIFTSIHEFDLPEQGFPVSGVTLDAAGNIYGTVTGHTNGTVYRLTPSGSGWTDTVLYSFQEGADGGAPTGGLVLDQAGNIYGTTANAGTGGGGTVFQLYPVGGSWGLHTLHSFSSHQFNSGPYDTLLMDAAGNLYGTTYRCGAFAFGNVFELSPTQRGWTYTDLHDFTGGADGGNPVGGVSMDSHGNLFGTAVTGGQNAQGVVWEIIP